MQNAGRARRSRAGAPRGGIGRAGAGARSGPVRGSAREGEAGARTIGRWLKILQLRTIFGIAAACSASLTAITNSKSESQFTDSGPDERTCGANEHSDRSQRQNFQTTGPTGCTAPRARRYLPRRRRPYHRPDKKILSSKHPQQIGCREMTGADLRRFANRSPTVFYPLWQTTPKRWWPPRTQTCWQSSTNHTLGYRVQLRHPLHTNQEWAGPSHQPRACFHRCPDPPTSHK